MTLGYRIEADGASVVYLCDHEPFAEVLSHESVASGADAGIAHEGDRRHARFMADAGLVIHDAQYTPEEYPAKKNWGHSTYEYAVDMAGAARVQQLVLTHHDPAHDDRFVEDLEQRARAYAAQRGHNLSVCLAFEGLEVTVAPRAVEHLADAPAAPQADRQALVGVRILVVDDDPDIRALATRALSQDGHIVNEASSGEEALRSSEADPPDLLVLDLLMPKQGGLEVLGILRSVPATAKLPVVLLTAMDDEASTRAGFELGATDYVTKPFTIPQLAARVRACLTRGGPRAT
jgi:CheY-like chemotaxis protein